MLALAEIGRRDLGYYLRDRFTPLLGQTYRPDTLRFDHFQGPYNFKDALVMKRDSIISRRRESQVRINALRLDVFRTYALDWS